MGASDDLDLERGREDDDGKRVSTRTERRHRARERQANDALESRLSAIFSRLAESIEGRGDEELAGVIREDTRAMVGGLVSLTKRVPAAAGALIASLSVLEPLIAFGRVFRLMLRRMGERRAEALAEWDAAQREEQGLEGQVMPPPAPEPVLVDEVPIAEPWKLG